MTHILSSHRWRRVGGLMLVLTLVTAVPCQAGPLWQALFGRRNNYYYPVGTQYAPVPGYYPVTAYYPVTTYYPVTAVGAVAPNAPVTVNYAPWSPASPPVTTGYAPVVSGVAPATAYGIVQPTAPATSSTTVTNFYAPDYATLPTNMAQGTVTPGVTVLSPSVNYGSAAVQAPTTVYSANLAAAATCATCPTAPRATGFFPQTSYRTVWYRVPVTSYRPTTAFDAAGQPVTALSPCTTYTWQARRVPAPSGGGFLSRLFGHRHRQQTAVLLPVTPQGVAQPSVVCAPQNFPVAPAAPAPGTTVPSIPGTSTIRDPADVRPSLDPNGYAPPMGSTTIREGSADTRQPVGVDTSVARTDASGPAMQPGPDRDALFNLKPVPDPNALRDAQKPFNPPRLLNPRDKSAVNAGPAAGSFVFVSWPESRSAASQVVPASADAPVLDHPTQPERRDDGGWRTKR